MAARRDEINIWEELHRRRAALGPFYVAGASTGAALGSTLMDTYPTAASLLTISGGTALWIRSVIRDKLRRAYAYTVTGASAGWVMAAHEFFRDYPDWMAASLISGTVVLGVPWWASRRRKSQVRMEETIQDWPMVASRIGLSSTRLVDVTMTPHGYEGTIIWPRGAYQVDSVMGNGDAIEGALGADAGSLELDRDGKSTHSVRFQVVTRDPHAMPQPWRPPTHVGSVTDPMVLGPDKGGTLIKLRRFVPDKGVRHMLIAGQTESGKSSLINLEVAESVCCHDTFTVGFDFKKVELTPWKPALGYFTSDFPKAKKFLRAVAEGVLAVRQDILSERGARVWDTKIDGPILNIVIDEIRELLGKGDPKVLDYFISIANLGRALGVRFVLSTQYPTLEALGSSQIRQQIRHCFCFRMKDSEGESYVMPGSRINADKIDAERPGTCYFKDGNRLYEKSLRIHYLGDPLVRAVAAARAGETSELDPRTEAEVVRLFPEFAERDRYYKEGDPRARRRDSGETASETRRESGETETGPSGTATAPIPPQRSSGGESNETESRGSETETGSGAGPVAVTTETDSEFDLADVIRAHRERQSPEDREASDRERERLLAEQPGRRLSPEEADAALIAALMEGGSEGKRAVDLYRAADRSQSWLYPKLLEMERDELVERTLKFGNWRLTQAGREQFGNSVAHSE